MTKPCMIVFHNDLDGAASAICIIEHIKQKYGQNATYVLWSGTYKNVDKYVERLLDFPERYEKIFIADIHVHPDLARQFPENVILLDHHSSAQELNNYSQCIIDTRPTVCGATMCYKHLLLDQGFKCDHLKSLVAIACDYDCWIHKLPKNIAKNLNFLYYHYWAEKFIDRFRKGFDKFNKEEIEIISKKWKEIEEQIKTTEYIDLLESQQKFKNKMCLISLKDNFGETNELCEHAIKTLHYDVIICVLSYKKRLSVRISEHAHKSGLNVGDIHTLLNIGGGHPRAGGAQYEDEVQLEKICETFANKVIELNI